MAGVWALHSKAGKRDFQRQNEVRRNARRFQYVSDEFPTSQYPLRFLLHRFATPLDEFMDRIGKQFAIEVRNERTLRISRETLPSTPTVIILDGV